MSRRSKRSVKVKRKATKKARKPRPRKTKSKPRKQKRGSKRRFRAGTPTRASKKSTTVKPSKTIKKEPSKLERMLREPPSYKNKYFTRMPEGIEANMP